MEDLVCCPDGVRNVTGPFGPTTTTTTTMVRDASDDKEVKMEGREEKLAVGAGGCGRGRGRRSSGSLSL